MKGKLKYVIGLVLFAALLGAAVWGYDVLSEEYGMTGEIQISDGADKTGCMNHVPDGDVPEDMGQEETHPVETETGEFQVEQVPDFTVLDGEGNEVKLSDYFGKPIVLNFWATWCGPCKAELPYFQNVYDTYGEDVHFLLVNLTDGSQETVDGVKKFLDDNGYDFPVYYDTELEAAMTYGASSIPQTFFIFADGTALGVYKGTISEEALITYTEMIINGEKP